MKNHRSLYRRCLLLGLLLAAASASLPAHCAAAPAAPDPKIAEEFRARGGLPNFFAKLAAGGPVRIAYFGGSITAANGWRPKTFAWFKEQYPNANLIAINAAISGTGSDYGACRIAGDVLAKDPDLVFLEHRVNGGGGFEAKSVEGIVRQIWKKSPRTDICLVYTLSQGMLAGLQAGRQNSFGAIMETVANAYGIPSIDLGVEIARREKAGELIFKGSAPVAGKLVFSADGVHPGNGGHEIYREIIARSMLAMKDAGKPQAHALPAPLSARCWESAALVPITQATLSPGWKKVDPKKDAVYREDFGRTNDMLRGAMKCDKAGETITFKWNGTTLGFSDIPQGQGMVVEVQIDNAPAPIVIKRPQTEAIRRYARFFYLPEQAPGEHTAVLRVQQLPAGLSFYAGQILVIGASRQSAQAAPQAEAARVYDATFAPGADKALLTPPAGMEPRINGAQVFGVRPGKPFLFQVAATGMKPLRYAAEGLPGGLAIDPATGLISGRAPAKAGECRVKLAVSNPHATASRELRIVVGDTLCLTPPMGWNSWYAHSEAVSDASIRKMADAVARFGLVEHGWTYINIDDCWTGERDPQTKAIRGNVKFPDMNALSAYIHGKGLKLGVYSTTWMSTYAGYIGGSAPNPQGDYSASYLPEAQRLNPAQYFGRYPGGIRKGLCTIGEAWMIDRDARQFAEWGVDYVKYDWKEWSLVKNQAGAFAPAKGKSEDKSEAVTKRFHDDFRAVDRDIVISLSPRHSAAEDQFVGKYANLWRLTEDIHADWKRIKAPFEAPLVDRFKLTRPGAYGDLDMLQIGMLGQPNNANTVFKPSPLTGAEQYFQVSLWAMLQQPLLLSCDLTQLDPFTLNLITNDEVLAVDQDALGKAGTRVRHEPGSFEIWRKPLADGSLAVGLFNLADQAQAITVSRAELGLRGGATLRDLWRQQDLGPLGSAFAAKVAPHGVVLLRLVEAK